MVQTGEGHFQKVYQNGELVATEPFVNQAVASIDLTLYATAADLQNTVVGGTVDNTNNLGGLPMSAFQQKADEPKTHEVMYYLTQVRATGLSVAVPTELACALLEIVSYTIAGITSLRLTGGPLLANESFTWLPGSESITVFMADTYGTGVSGLYSCVPVGNSWATFGDVTPVIPGFGSVTLTKLAIQPKIGDMIHVNVPATTTAPADFWHPNWGTILVRSDDTHYSVVQPGVSTLSAVFTSSLVEGAEACWHASMQEVLGRVGGKSKREEFPS